MSYTFTDKRKNPTPTPQCRVCGSNTVHSHDYGHPTMECIKEQRQRILALEAVLQDADGMIDHILGVLEMPIYKNCCPQADQFAALPTIKGRITRALRNDSQEEKPGA